MEFALRGWTVIARKGSPWEVSRPKDDARARGKFQVFRDHALGVPEHQIIPMHHLGAALDAEDDERIA